MNNRSHQRRRVHPKATSRLGQTGRGRRAFLGGAGAVTIALPFLESLPERSAWAQAAEPRCALFIGTGNGVIVPNFWPSEFGPLDTLADDPNAAGILSAFADRLLFVQGLRYPASAGGSTHAQSYAQMYTGAPHDGGTSNNASSTAPSIDTLLAPILNPDAKEPLTLYAGNRSSWILERLSFEAAGEVRNAEDNPYLVYQELLRQADTGASPAANTEVLFDELRVRRQSAIDLVRDEATLLRDRSGISVADKDRMDRHLTALRDIEIGLQATENSEQPALCSESNLDQAGLAAIDGVQNQESVELVARLHLELVAFAFACDLNRVATLQHGDGEDNTVYDVESNSRGWPFHHISHQIQSDSTVGTDAEAVQAHIEIDRLRLETFNHGLTHFDAHGLLDRSIVMWTNQFSDGRSGSFSNLPTIVAGNPDGGLKSGQHIRLAERHSNGDMLTTLAQVLGANISVGTPGSPIEELLSPT